MSHHNHSPATMRICIVCGPSYQNRRAIMEALGTIFIDTIEQEREYYYFRCPAIDEIFDDGVINRAMFHELTESIEPASEGAFQGLKFNYVVAAGDDAFVAKLMHEIGAGDALLVRLS